MVLVVVLLTGALLTAEAAVKSFPTAEGLGANSRGGRGGRVIKVINLNDRGTGSLRACMENTGPRTCIFTVGGTIALNSNIRVSGSSMSYLTVAGQTAPGGGIQLKNFGIYLVNGVHDVIIRHLRIRPGHERAPRLYGDGFALLIYADSPHDIIIDHVSMQWGTYMTYEHMMSNGEGVGDITVQWSMIGVAENDRDYVDPQGNPALSFSAGLGGWGDENLRSSFHHNLLHSSEGRQPLMGQGFLDFVNNIMFNWYACHGASAFGTMGNNDGRGGWQVRANLVNNIWIPGPTQTGCYMGTLGRNPFAQIYLSGIRTPFCGACVNPTLNDAGFRGEYADGSPEVSDSIYRVGTPFPAPPITVTPLDSLEATLVANVGATKPRRDSLDTLYLNQFQARQGGCGEQPRRIGCRQGQPYPNLAGGTPPVDSDGDGIPNTWEQSRGLNPNNSADGAQTAANGYTNLENYLNELAGDTAPGGNLPTLAAPPHEFSPASGPPGATVSINGLNLAAAPVTVTFGAAPAPVLSTSPTRITAAVPAMSPGAVVLTVTTAVGSVSSRNTFQVKPRGRHR